MATGALDSFGRFIIEKLRDKSLEQNEMLLRGQLKGQAIQRLQGRVAALSDEQRRLVREVVVDVVDTALHDLLFAFQEAHDLEAGIEVIAHGQNVAELSDGLQGEPLGEDGWISRFSKYAAERANG